LSRQRFSLDRLCSLSYIGAGLLLAACPGRPGPLIPEPLAPVPRDTADAWTRMTVPPRTVAIRFRWKYRDERLSGGGRGTARIAPPDSLRLDYVAVLGLASGAGVVIGDSVVWAEPSADFRRLVPAVPMLWAALGTVRPPAVGADVAGRRDGDGWRWRFTAGGDTLEYVTRQGSGAAGRELDAEWRRAGRVVARSVAQLDPGARPVSGRIDFPEGPARFEFTVSGIDTAVVVLPQLWRSRR
jgi:hypothetical protein